MLSQLCPSMLSLLSTESELDWKFDPHLHPHVVMLLKLGLFNQYYLLASTIRRLAQRFLQVAQVQVLQVLPLALVLSRV